ncbi:MAG: hypothetical protein AN485_06680 [Anabaena sp. MDT14b]|nr:MAG: hypothetical protein AN485_06680 [Anabaena sp. MDT14b]
MGVAFNNTGTVEAQSGTLNLTNTYTHNNANLILKGGTVTFSNALNINGGSIEGNGSINVGVTNSGLLNPRYASNTEFGRLTINSNYTETNSANINIQLGGSTAGTNFDQVDINGIATFDGTLNVSLLNNFTPTLGSTFDVLTYDSLSFLSNLNFTGLDINSTLQFVPQWFNNKLTLKVVNKSTATNINVTTNQDVVNASDSVLSLREAVIEANQNGLDNTIILGAQTYNLSFSGGSDDDFAATGDLDILPRGGRVTIQGQGANQTFITATNLANLFQIHPGATINFSNVTVIGNPSSLTLTGTSGNDFLVGGVNNDLLTSGGGKDTLTGGLGSDKFVYQNLTDSLLANFDVITDFNATTGNDLFLVSTARAGFVNVGAVNTLDTAGIEAKLTAAAFGSNFAAQFSFGQKTFVAINDATAGFNAANDAIIEVTGLTGILGLNNFTTV